MFGKFFNANLKKRVFDTSNDHYFCVLYQKLFDDPILILRDNSVFSFNQESEHYTFFDYYQDLYVETYIDQVKKPHMIYTGIGNIPQLESMTLDKNTVEKLNQTGLNIYLYELLSFRYNVVDKFYIDPINYERSDNSAKDVFSEKASTENGFSYELDSIQQFVVNNRLTGVTVFTCEYFSRELFSDKYPEFKIKSKDIFVQSLFSEKSDPIRKNFNSDEIKYKFWLSNWRYTSFRNIVAAYVCQRSCLISWNYNISNENFLKEIWFDLNYKREKILKGNEYLNRHGPYTIDLPAKMSIKE